MTTQYAVNPKADLAEHIAAIRAQLASLEQALKGYEQMDKVDYGHVGDLSYVRHELSEAVEFLTDHSGYDEDAN